MRIPLMMGIIQTRCTCYFKNVIYIYGVCCVGYYLSESKETCLPGRNATSKYAAGWTQFTVIGVCVFYMRDICVTHHSLVVGDNLVVVVWVFGFHGQTTIDSRIVQIYMRIVYIEF